MPNASIEQKDVYMKYSFATINIGALAVGIQLSLCLCAFSLYKATPPSSRKARFPYIVLSFMILAVYLIPVSVFTMQFTEVFIKHTGGDQLALVTQRRKPWFMALGILARYVVVFMGDGLMIYRCHMMWPNHRWITVLPCVTYFASLALACANSASYMTPKLSRRTYSSGAIVLSVFANVYVTAMIVGHILLERRKISRVLSPGHLAKYTRVSAILIESALPLTVLGLITIIIQWALPSELPLSPIFSVLQAMWHSFSAISPQLTIFRVLLGSSATHHVHGMDSQSISLRLYGVVAQEESTIQDYVESQMEQEA